MSAMEKPNLSTMSSSDIHYLLSERINELRKPWPAVIQFPIIEIRLRTPTESYFDPTSGAPIQLAMTKNICEYFDGARSDTVARIYFDPRKYPPPLASERVICDVKKKDKCYSSKSWNDLFRDLGISALNNGTILTNNGGGSDRRVIQCTHNHCNRKQYYCPIVPTDDNPLQKTSLINDHKNARKIEKGAPGAPRQMKLP